MPRTPPPRTGAQQQEYDRRQALTSLDVPAMRAWATEHAVGLLGDDRTVLISMHETRATDPRMPRRLRDESIAWLKGEYPASVVLVQIARHPAAFTGPTYGKRKEARP